MNQFVITSRIAGWRGGINADFELFYVNDLSDYQIDTFIDTWYSAVERNAVIGRLKDEGAAERRARERRASQRAEDLKVTLRDNIGIRRLATNPMLLSIIAVVHRGLATLPKERGKLYAQCSKILLEQWDISRGIRVDDTNLKLEQKEAIMRRLAIAFHTGEIGNNGAGREASRSDVQSMIAEMLPRLGRPADEASHLLQMLIERGGIIVERQRGLLAFAHHTFQEYFTAQDLASREQNGAFLLAEGRLLSDWWREVVLLYAGLLSDSSDFIESIYNSNTDELVQPRMRLAALCLVEAVEVRRTEVRELIISTLLDIRAPGSIGKLQITPEVADYLLDWCRDEGWYSAAAIAKVKQTNEVDQVIHEIEKALKHQQSVIRRAAAECVAFLPMSTPDTLVEQLIANLADSDYHVRKNVVEALGSIASPTNARTVAEHLIEMLYDDDPNVVVSAIRSLFKIRRWLDPDYALLQKVTAAIGGSQRTTVGLIAGSILLASANQTILERFFSEAQGLEVQDLATLLQITNELGGDIRHKLEPDSAASIITEILQEERILSDLNMPESVIGILAEILVHDCGEIVDRLLALATQKNLYFRRYAVNAIAEMATSLCADHIRGKVGKCLATSDSAAREVAFQILLRGPSELLSNDNIKLVIKWSANNSWRTRRSCALVLAKVRSPEGQAVAKQQLLRLTKDSHSQVRAASLVALGHIEGAVGSDTMKAIFAALNERSDRIQMAACVALFGTHKNFDVRPIVPKLLTVLNSTQETFFTLIRQWIEIIKDNPFPFRKRHKIPFVIQALAAIADLETAELIFDNVLNALRLHGEEEQYYGHIFDDNADEWIAVRKVSEKALELRYDDYLIQVSDGKLSFMNYTDQEEFPFEVSNDPIAELVAKLPVAIRTQKVNVLLNDDNNLIKLIGLRIVRSLKDSLDLAVIEESIIRLWADDDRFLRRAAFSTAGLVFADTNQPATVDALLKQLSIDKDGHEYAWSAIQIVSGAGIVSQYQSSEVS